MARYNLHVSIPIPRDDRKRLERQLRLVLPMFDASSIFSLPSRILDMKLGNSLGSKWHKVLNDHQETELAATTHHTPRAWRQARRGLGDILVTLRVLIFALLSCAPFAMAQLAAKSAPEPPEVVLLKERPAARRTVAGAPEVSAATLQHNIKNFQQDDNLSLSLASMVTFLVDSLGRVWLGTYALNLDMYDGQKFTSFSTKEGVTSPVINAMALSRNGNIWIATMIGGVGVYDGSRFLNFTTKDGLASNNVHSIAFDSKGRIWFGTEGGASLYDGVSFKNFTKEQGLPAGTINTILADNDGNIWFGSNGGVSRYDGKVFKNYTTKDALTNNTVLSSLKDGRGTLWFGTQHGVSVYEHGQFRAFEQNSSLPGQSIRALFQDSLGRIWFGTENGASVWDKKSFKNLSRSEGLAANDIRAIGEDPTGAIWILSFSGGPSRYNGEFLSWFDSTSLPGGYVGAIVADSEGAIWFAGPGLVRYDGRSFAKYTTAQGLVANKLIRALFDHAHNLWLGSADGMSKFDGKSFVNYSTEQGLVGNYIYDLIEDKKGNLWIATLSGVSKFDGRSFTNYRVEQGLSDLKVNTLFEDSKGRIWAFHWFSGAVDRFDGTRFVPIKSFRDAGAAFEDNEGNIWFAAIDRLVRFDGDTYLNFTTEDGLPSNFIVGVHSITRGKDSPELLLGTTKGISLLTGFKNTKTKEIVPALNTLKNSALTKDYVPIFENYNVDNGYLIKDVEDSHDMCFDAQGKLWLATGYLKTTVLRLDFSALKKSTLPPLVLIQSVKIDNKNVSWNLLLNKNNASFDPQHSSALSIEEMQTFGRKLSDKKRESMLQEFGDISFAGLEKYFPVPKKLVLPHDHNNVSFSFFSVDTSRPNNLLYQYKLEGFNKDWIPPTPNTFASFDNIYEGTYELKVKARSPDGVWGQPTTYTFVVLPPWYRTWWAYVLYACTIASVLFGIYRWRTAALRKRHKLLTILYEAAERFVPKAFLSLLGKSNIQDVKLGDSIETNVTVLFSDIRSYTTLAERLKPSESYAFINSYWAATAPIIDQHQGFISQYLGDGVMALFARHPDDAVEAVLDMMDALDVFNREQAKIGGHQISVGYGLSTGPAMLGTIGVKKRMDANVISNTSNLSSRVESLNKFYGTRFLVTNFTLEALTDLSKYTFRFVDKIKAKGMHNTVKLWEIYKRGPVSENERVFIQTYEGAFEKYENGDFKSAIIEFQKCLVLKPEDHSSVVLIERSESLIKSGAPQGWEGVFEMVHK